MKSDPILNLEVMKFTDKYVKENLDCTYQDVILAIEKVIPDYWTNPNTGVGWISEYIMRSVNYRETPLYRGE